ncbi:MAG TPA: portal protein, partial [Rheinheimera sp.]|nr:portal protein [Rheinheimera sp.]
MSWKKHFTPVDNSGLPLNIQPKDTTSYSAASNRFESWLPEVYAGSADRLLRYQQYDNMDGDPEINTALDTIAEFGTQEDEYSGLPFDVNYEEDPSETESKIINKTLRQWCKLNDLYKRAFRIFRNTCKYGDQIFIRDPETYELHW